MARYDAGETLASIARTYDCSPPAISYVVSRSRARDHDPQPAPPSASEPQLIKADAAASAIAKAAPAATETPPQSAPATPPPQRDERPPSEAAPSVRGGIFPRAANGFAGGRETSLPGMPASTLAPRPTAPAGQSNGDARRTLHLSLGGAASGNGSAPTADPTAGERHGAGGLSQPAPPPPTAERPAPPVDRNPPPYRAAPDRGHDNSAAGFAEARPAPRYTPSAAPNGDSGRRPEAGPSFIDQELRARVDGDIAAFLAAFDAALVEDTQETRAGLREATDRLLRAGARTRIELERLEARLPLPPRDGNGRGEPAGAWRHRYAAGGAPGR